MDFDKMKQWMEMAQNMSGGDFWKNVFDDEQLKSFQNGHSHFPFQQGDGQMRRNEDAFPLIDIVETHDELQFLLYLPGYRKQDVQLLSYGEYIVVKGTRKSFFNEQDFKQKTGKYGDFEKNSTFRIPLKVRRECRRYSKTGFYIYRLLNIWGMQARSLSKADLVCCAIYQI